MGHRLASATRAVSRLIVPVMALLISIAALYLYRDTPPPAFLHGTGPWMTLAHLLVPAGFFCVFLTNRRYGPAFAFAQVVVACAAIVAMVTFLKPQLMLLVPHAAAPPMREAVAFGASFFVTSFIAIVVFDGARGAQWWTAPLFGFVAAGIFFALIFVPAAYAGAGFEWVVQIFQYMGLLIGEGIFLLVPYWMMRGAVPPMSGFGGY